MAVTAYSAVIEWSPPPSLIAISHYSVLLYHDGGDSGQLGLLRVLNYTAGAQNSTEFGGMRPYAWYIVEVVAVNRARNSTRSFPLRFRTLEAGKTFYNHTVQKYCV